MIVDVGMPVAGRAAFIGAAIESVCAQTLEAWCLHISQVGSDSEAVREAVAPYLSDPRITYQATSRTVGAPENKTALIQRGSAPYVAILDDDDVWLPLFLERQVAFLEQHPAAGLVFCANTVIDKHGNETGRSRIVLAEGLYEPREFVPRLIDHNPIATPTVLVRRAAYATVGAQFDNALQTNHDYDMSIRLATRFPVGYRPSYDASYRQHGDQATLNKRSLRASEAVHLLDKVEATFATQPSPLVSNAVFVRQRAGWALSTALNQLEQGDRRGAWAAVTQAARISPRALLDPRLAPIAAGLIGGRRTAPALRAARGFVLRHGLRGGQLQRRRPANLATDQLPDRTTPKGQ